MQPLFRSALPAGFLLASASPALAHAQPVALAQAGRTLGSTLLLLFALLALAGAAAAGVMLLRRRRRAAYSHREHSDPPLVFPMPRGEARRPVPLGRAEPEPQPIAYSSPQPPASPPAPPSPAIPEAPPLAAPAGTGERVPASNGLPRARPSRPAEVPATSAGEAPPRHPMLGEEAGNGSELVEGHTIRYYRPADSTVQFLPGRLEVVEGDDIGQDIRFIRTQGTVPEITFGRSAGPPHRHVQLRARTVSREHARLRYEGERWRIHNLSRTNPVLVNGEELDATSSELPLKDGDLIEMGEVVFRFRER